jgi:hypothetical protein
MIFLLLCSLFLMRGLTRYVSLANSSLHIILFFDIIEYGELSNATYLPLEKIYDRNRPSNDRHIRN